jgi:hypothetical protein
MLQPGSDSSYAKLRLTCKVAGASTLKLGVMINVIDRMTGEQFATLVQAR